MGASQPAVLLLSDDLIFTSRIASVARDAGLPVRSARNVDLLESMARQTSPTLVIVDLAHPGLTVPDLLSRLAAACPQRPYVVAYGAHVDAVGLRAARQAGCDVVLPRSAFVEELPQRIHEWAAPAH